MTVTSQSDSKTVFISVSHSVPGCSFFNPLTMKGSSWWQILIRKFIEKNPCIEFFCSHLSLKYGLALMTFAFNPLQLVFYLRRNNRRSTTGKGSEIIDNGDYVQKNNEIEEFRIKQTKQLCKKKISTNQINLALKFDHDLPQVVEIVSTCFCSIGEKGPGKKVSSGTPTFFCLKEFHCRIACRQTTLSWRAKSPQFGQFPTVKWGDPCHISEMDSILNENCSLFALFGSENDSSLFDVLLSLIFQSNSGEKRFSSSIALSPTIQLSVSNTPRKGAKITAAVAAIKTQSEGWKWPKNRVFSSEEETQPGVKRKHLPLGSKLAPKSLWDEWQ